MTNLYKIGNSLNREERNNLNATFDDILRRFGHLQKQISDLSGSEEVQDLLDQIANATQQAIEAQQAALDAEQSAIDATNDAIQAKNEADNATQNANDKADYAEEKGNYIADRQAQIDFFLSVENNIQAQINQLVISGDSSPEAAQARVDIEDVEHATLKERIDNDVVKINQKIDDEIGTVTQQLAQNMKKGTLCSEINLIPNNISESGNNTIKLINAINLGYKILVDDVYYLSTNNLTVVKGIDLTGFSLQAELKLVHDGTNGSIFKFEADENIKIESVSFTNETTFNITLINVIGMDWFIEKFDFNKNKVSGNMSVIYAANDKNKNPLTNKMGFDLFNFNYNVFRNTDKVSVVNLFDTPCKLFTLEKNNVTNFSNKFFGVTISNDGAYSRQFYDAIEMLVAKDNIVKCENDFWATVTGGYYAFILYEGNRCIYENNSVEGMKSTQADVSLYDCYLSATHVVYKNNVNKNNVLFRNPKTENVLMKSKEGSFANKLGSRLYESNNFIIEKSFILQHGELSQGYVFMLDIISPILDYKIINNKFDVYELRLMGPANSQLFYNITFEGNTIIAEIIRESLFNIYVNDATKRNIFIRKNTIESSTSYRLVSTSKIGDYKLSKLVIDNNTLNNSNLTTVVFSDETLIKNNDISCDVDTTLHYDGDLGVFETANNTIKAKNDSTRITHYRSNRKANRMVEKNEYFMKLNGDNSQGIMLPKINKVNKSITYFVSTEIYYADGIQSFDYKFTYGYDETNDYNYIEYTNTSNTIQRANLSTGSASLEMKVNNKTSIERCKIHIVFNSDGVNIRPSSNVTYSTHVKQTVNTVIQEVA